MTTESNPPAGQAGEVAIGPWSVRRLGFGTMRLVGSDGEWPADKDGAIQVLRRAVALGVNLFDTANLYGPEIAESLVAEALWPYDNLLIATKGGFRPGRPPTPDGRPESLKDACEGSLRRLRVHHIDLYQLHVPDPDVPYEESVGALRELQEAGKIRHIGVSNVGRRQLTTAQQTAEIVSVQNRFGVGDQAVSAVVDVCTEQGIAFLPWGPILAGTSVADALADVATKHGATTAQVALAWTLGRSPVIVAIPGTSQVAHLEENVAAAALELTDTDLAALEAAQS